MQFRDLPIQKKLMIGTILISGVILLVTCTTFFAYEFYKFRQTAMEKITMIGKIISANGTSSLAFINQKDAEEILASLKSETHITAACFYDKDGNFFSHYPSGIAVNAFPAKPEKEGYRFVGSYLEGFEPVVESGVRLGTLYLKYDLADMYDRFRLYGTITASVIVVSILLSYLLSRILQKSIAKPILVLAETAKVISEKKDYSVRAVKLSKDELGSLTDAFNLMLSQIQTQNQALSEFNQQLEQRIRERTMELESVNKDLESHAEQLKESEEQIQTIFRSAPDAVIVIDEEGKIIRWNPRAEIIFGWHSNEVLGKFLHEVIIPERFREAHQKGIKHFLKTKEGSVLNKPLELAALRRDNTEFDAGISISPTVLKGKHYFIGFVSDISYRKKAEAEIQQKSEALVRSNKELEQFAYIASHDLQEPLRMVSSFLQLLERKLADKLDKDTKEYIDFAVDGSKRMKNMVEDLLSYSRIISGKTQFEKTDLNKILEDVHNNLKESISESEAKISYEKMPTIAADNIKMTRLFQNLISNAIKFRKKDVTPVIEINYKEEKDVYLFSVKDNGIGIKKEYHEKIFVIFQRLNSKEEYPGTGIGLAECEKIVRLHGGKIWVESEEGKGSTFYFTINKQLSRS